MNESLEDIRRDIEQTRLALGEKVSRLEQRIETTATKTLNPAFYVRKRPWPTLGLIALTGWFVGRAFKSKKRGSRVNAYPVNGYAQDGITKSIARSLAAGAAGSMAGLASDLVRDLVKDRRKDKTP